MEEKNTVAVSMEEAAVQQSASNGRRYLRPRETVAFLLTNFGQKNLKAYVDAFRQFFVISFLGISGSTYGIIMFIESIYDAVDDSISGLIIDRTRTRWGRLRPWLIIPTPFWAVSLIMLFSAPSFLVSQTQKIIWAVFSIFIYNLGMSYYGAWNIMLYNITPNQNERNSLIATSKFFELFGMFLPSFATIFVSFVPRLTNNRVGMQEVYSAFAVVIALVAGGTAIYGFIAMRERVPLASRQQMQETSILDSIKNVFKNRPMFVLFLANFFTGFKAVGAASESFYWLHNTKSLFHGTVAGLFTGIPNYIMVPLTPKLVRKFGARNVAVAAGLFGGVAYLATFIIGLGGNGFLVNWEGGNTVVNLAILTLCLTICGLPNQVMNVVNAILQGDVYDYSEWKTGMRNEALVQTFQNYFDKAAGSITQLLSGVVISAVGYIAHKDEFGNIIPETNHKTLMGFWALFCLMPSIARFLYGITMIFFNVKGKMKEEMLRDLEISRRERVEKMSAEEKARISDTSGYADVSENTTE